MSKAAILAKYGGPPPSSRDVVEKKKRKKKNVGAMRIIDEDVTMRDLTPSEVKEELPKATWTVYGQKEEKEEEEDEEAVLKFVQIKRDDGSGWQSVGEAQRGPEPTSTGNIDSDHSPPRRSRHDSPSPSRGEDLSPRRARHDSPDLSPPRARSGPTSGSAGQEASGDGDLSPPRRGARRSRSASWGKTRVGSPDMSPPRRRDDSDADLSPPRRRNDSDADLSPPRRRADSAADLSPPRRRADSDADLSPPRAGQGQRRSVSAQAQAQAQPQAGSKRRRASPSSSRSSSRSRSRSAKRSRRHDSPEADKSREKAAAAARTGLQTGRDFQTRARAEADEKLRVINSMSAEQSGVGAQTVVRDKTGRKLSVLEQKLKQPKGEDDETGMVWGKGLVQESEKELTREELDEIRVGAFGRGRDDARLNAWQEERDRWGDPMLAAIKKKKKKREEQIRQRAQAEADAAEASGGPRRAVPRPMYDGTPWLNRFGIKPGYRWDGYDRSNKWEEKWFRAQNERKANEVAAYKWSSENM